MGLRIYVGLLLLIPKGLSLPFDPQENTFCPGLLPTPPATIHVIAGSAGHSSVEGFPRWVSLLQGKDFPQLCDDI